MPCCAALCCVVLNWVVSSSDDQNRINGKGKQGQARARAKGKRQRRGGGTRDVDGDEGCGSGIRWVPGTAVIGAKRKLMKADGTDGV